MRAALTAAIACACAATAAAETRRVAVVVGHNTGNAGQVPLRFAEIDASKIGRVFTELGGVAPSDLYLVQGKDLAALQAVLARARAAIAAYQRAGDRVVALFYYSGHSDGLALELGPERFTFSALRAWLEDTGAEVRLAIVDSCRSGALVATKGGSPGPAFSIRLTDHASTSGEALLTSSAGDENALESKEIGGSFFTHHLVSGLRGAADVSGDGRVTLNEAYQYAYKHTISTSAATLAGPQHPTYDYRLTGQGELVLTELARPTSALALPPGFQRALVIEAARGQVLAEVGAGDPVRIALAPGRYGVRAWRAGKTYETHVAIASGEQREVRWDELREVELAAAIAKGGADLEQRLDGGPLAMSVGVGGRAGIADDLSALAGARVGLRSPRLRGPSIALDASTRRDGMLRETSAFLLAGYRLGVASGRLRASLAVEGGGGAIVQSLGGAHATGAAMLAPGGELALVVSPRLSIALEAQLAATLLKRDSELVVTALPAVWLGAVVRP